MGPDAGPLNPQGVLAAEPFADVPTSHWAYRRLELLRQHGLLEGRPGGKLCGGEPMRRQEWAQFLERLVMAFAVGREKSLEATARKEPFPGVLLGHWAYSAVESLRQQGVPADEPRFRGADALTREELEASVKRIYIVVDQGGLDDR